MKKKQIKSSDIRRYGNSVMDVKSIHWSYNDYSDITLSAAKLIEKSSGDFLRLEGITNLNPEKARAIAKFKGSTIELPGLRGIDAEVLGELSSFKGDRLKIGVGSRLDLKMAEALANYKGCLNLVAVAEIDEEVTPLIQLGKFHSLSLTRLSKILPSQYQQLQNLGKRLDSITVTTLSRLVIEENVPFNINEIIRVEPDLVDVSDLFCKIVGSKEQLNFKSLLELDVHTARIISQFSCGINLPKIVKLSVEASSYLALHKGPYINLPAVKKISVKSAMKLISYKGILCLDGLSEFDGKLENILSQFEGTKISLNGLREMPINSPLLHLRERLCIEKLTSLNGVDSKSGVKISPKHLREITPPQAEWLAQEFDFLDLSSLQEIDEKSALALATHTGRMINLKNLKTIPKELLEKKNGEIRFHVKNFDRYSELDTDKHSAILQIANKIVSNVVESTGQRDDWVNKNSNLIQDVGMDSLDMVEMRLECEEHFDVDFDDKGNDLVGASTILAYASVIHMKQLRKAGNDKLCIVFVDE